MVATFTRCEGSRRGILNLGGAVVHTPALVIPTSLYAVANLTRDMYDQVMDPSRTIFEVYLEDLHENLEIIRRLPFSFKKYAHLEGYALWLAIRESRYFVNAEGFTHINSERQVSGVNHAGVIKMTMEEIKELHKIVKPDSLLCPVDHFPLPGSEKRLKKAALRTSLYLDALNECSPIPSFFSSDSIASNDSIVAISGYSEGSTSLPLLSEKAIYIRGTHDIRHLVKLLKNGQVDLIDCSILMKMSEQGQAIISAGGDSFEIIDLNDVKYLKDTTKLQPDCPCPGCQFMKAYIHHLFVVHEMLGPSAVTAHNIYQLFQIIKFK